MAGDVFAWAAAHLIVGLPLNWFLLPRTETGPAQTSPSSRLAAMTHPIGAAALGIFGGGAAAGVCAVLHGSGTGILTIARGTVPLAIFGAANYGSRLGLLGAPARIAQAGAPLIFGLAIEHWGARSLMLSSVCGLAALAAFCMVRSGAIPEAATDGQGDQQVARRDWITAGSGPETGARPSEEWGNA